MNNRTFFTFGFLLHCSGSHFGLGLAAVMVSDLNQESANAVVQEIIANGGKAATIAFNITKEEVVVLKQKRPLRVFFIDRL